MEVEIDEAEITSQRGDSEVDLAYESNQQEGCVNHELIGLSPSYWSHLHMTVYDVQQLVVYNGIDCMIAISNETDVSYQNKQLFIPVSRCEIDGVIVGIDNKSGGRTIYLIDDGTGMIDCVQWNSYNDLSDLESSLSNKALQLGDTARILGKIRTISCDSSYGGTREIHIDLIQCYSDALPNNETLHWLKCIHTGKRVVNAPYSRSLFKKLALSLKTESTYYRRMRNGNEIAHDLDLDPKTQSVLNYDDDWEYFGVDCCCEVSYKKPLLYCHCHAKYVKTDPEFRFRDCVLQYLLETENKLQDDGPLVFSFKSVLQNPEIHQCGEELLGKGKNLFILLAATFEALRNDGVIYLNDMELDEYLLISCSRVLEPFVKDSMNSFLVKTNPPNYVQHIPRRRITYLKNRLKKSMT